MKKIVYKITNLINGKIYIGQTNNLKRRIQEHKHDKRANKPIRNAIQKHGWENFKVEELYYGENYNEKEKKFILLFDSRNKEKGYNIVEGGQDSAGEGNPASILKQKQVDEVINLLLNTKLTTTEISKKTGISLKNIRHINSGTSWKQEKTYKYPLRNISNALNKEIVEKIIFLLKKNETIEEIIKKTNVKRYTILNINRGKIYKKEKLKYPIKDLHLKNQIEQIITDLKENKNSIKEIAEKHKISTDVIYRINLGRTHVNKNLEYPIRKNCRN